MRSSLPMSGQAWPALRERMVSLASGDVAWRDGRAAVYVFNAGSDIEAVQKEAYTLFMAENGLGPSAFPSLKRMEADVVDFGLSLLGAPGDAVGNMTTGGTDSITMAMKAARDFARRERRREGRLNIVLPRSAHPAFDKAAALMEIEVRRTSLRDLRADADAMAAAVDDHSMMIVGSAPCFPYGLIDPIEPLSDLAIERDLWLHVDACVGGYIAPFVRMNGTDLPPFDFALPGVSSMSADLHKYGYCSKGASTVFFRSEQLRRHMPFEVHDWPGGRMVTPTLAGTRPGGAIAAAWAVMNYLGVEGYRARHALVTDARERLETGVRARGYEVVGEPKLGLVAFRKIGVDSISLWKALHRRGWFSSLTTEPASIHLMLSPVHGAVIDDYLADLELAERDASSGQADVAQPRYGG